MLNYRYFIGVFLGMTLFGLTQKPAHATPDFTAEPNTRISTASPQVIIGSYPAVQMLFIQNFQVRSATSADGFTWSVQGGLQVSTATPPLISFSSITACSVLPLDEGGYRMIYAVATGTSGYRFHSATSTTGTGWANDSGTRLEVNSGNTFIGSPTLVELPTGNWRLFYIQDSEGDNEVDDYQIFTSLSSDQGLTWSTGQSLITEQAGDVGAMQLTNNRIRLIYTAPLTSQTTNSTLRSALSSDTNGTQFDLETGARFSIDPSTAAINSPLLFRSTDTFRWRAYYNFQSHFSTSNSPILSAITNFPDPQGISPTSVNQLVSTQTYSISGEIFSSTTPTVVLRRSGETDITGTSVVRNSDQSLEVSFDTSNRTVGTWDVVVTNSDGNSGTLAGGFLIDFSPGFVILTDNLIRPRLSQQTQIEITAFTEGLIKVELLTLDGRLVRTLSEQVRSAGTFTIFWDGRTASGKTVASGVYFVRTTGPKLNSLKKIVVIK